MDLKKITGECGLDSPGLRYCIVLGCCADGNEIWSFKKFCEFLTTCQLSALSVSEEGLSRMQLLRLYRPAYVHTCSLFVCMSEKDGKQQDLSVSSLI